MAFCVHEVKDYSTPYKTFNDLDLDDNIYIIDIKNVSYKKYQIKEYIKEESKSYYKQNCFEIEFKIDVDGKLKKFNVYDGNRFLEKVTLFSNTYNNDEDTFISTDERICELVIEILKSRMNYQWGEFLRIFGNPLAGKYEPRHIVLG